MNTSRRNARGEASLQRILQSTVQLVGRYGFDNTTIARIVKATDRPASSIYWFFENKDELIAAALENSYSQAGASRRPWEEFSPTVRCLTNCAKSSSLSCALRSPRIPCAWASCSRWREAPPIRRCRSHFGAGVPLRNAESRHGGPALSLPKRPTPWTAPRESTGWES